jgi:DNA repair protein RadC
MHTQSNQLYIFDHPASEHQVLEEAAKIIQRQHLRGNTFNNPEATKDFLRFKLHQHEREVFGVMLLDSQHQLIEYQELFFGTINAANIYPREVLKAVLDAHASAVIFAHNHPSGITEPSQADIEITKVLKEALSLIDVRVLDHIVVGKDSTSFAERGLL